MRSTRGATLLALLLSSSANALSSWYTPPGGTPAGSVAGDKIRGVNLGGWFILENWMMPSLFEVAPLNNSWISDEWTYCATLGEQECLSRLQTHWDTYVTEDDFKRFANYSLNAVRIPMGYWSWTDPENYEPYVQGQLTYLERALNWSSMYGLDVMLDMHGLPGGQNGQDNQGYKGPIEFANNATNMDRAMDALANMTKFVTDPKWGGVVKAIELTNEPYILAYNPGGMEFDVLAEFYVQGYQVVRNSEHIISGNNEVMVVIHDAFQPLLNWQYFWSQPTLGQNWTNYALDTHIYDAFGDSANKTFQEHLDTICYLASSIQTAQQSFPVIVGEFSLGTQTYCVDYTSCFGETLNQVSGSLTDEQTSLFLRQFWEVQVDAYELGAGWIFWSFSHELAAPWSWQQSAAQNWIPTDPTEKIWPFDPTQSAGCLNTASPYAGDQNLPYFPSYINPITNIDIANVKPKYNTTLLNATGGQNHTSGNLSDPIVSSSTPQPTSTSSIVPAASSTSSHGAVEMKSGAERRAVSTWLLLGLLGFLAVRTIL